MAAASGAVRKRQRPRGARLRASVPMAAGVSRAGSKLTVTSSTASASGALAASRRSSCWSVAVAAGHASAQLR